MKCKQKESEKKFAVADKNDWNVTFGKGSSDIYCSNNCNNDEKSKLNLGHTYEPPSEYKGDPKHFFAGQYKFKVSEIEIYQIKQWLLIYCHKIYILKYN